MKYFDYAEKIKDIPYPERLGYHIAVVWLHPERMPLGVVSLGDETMPVVKIPHEAVNNFYPDRYHYTVPVIAIARDLFRGREDITDIVLPSTIQRLPEYAFEGCKNLRRITLPKNIRTILKGTFEGCENLIDIYYEGSREEWEQINIVHQKHECELGEMIPGTPVQQITSERIIHIPGNEPVFSANVHFHCDLTHAEGNPEFHVKAGKKDITALFHTMD